MERLGRVSSPTVTACSKAGSARARGDEQRVVAELLDRAEARDPARGVDGDDGLGDVSRRRSRGRRGRARRGCDAPRRERLADRQRARDEVGARGDERDVHAMRREVGERDQRLEGGDAAAGDDDLCAVRLLAVTLRPARSAGRPRHAAVGIRGNPQASRSLERADGPCAAAARRARACRRSPPRRTDDDRVAVELGDRGEVVGERADPAQDVLERADVGRRRTAVAAEQRERRAARAAWSWTSASVSGARRTDVGEQLGGGAARRAGDDRAEPGRR